MMVEITGMQHKGVNGNVHNHTGDRLHVTFRYQGPLLSYYSWRGFLLRSDCLVDMTVHAKLCMYCTIHGSFCHLPHRVLGALFRREFWYIFRSPDRCGVILGKPWVLYDPSTLWMATRIIPKFRLSYQRGWMLCDPAILVWHLRIVCRLFVGWKAWLLTCTSWCWSVAGKEILEARRLMGI